MPTITHEPLSDAVDRARVEALYAKLLTPMVTVIVNSALLAAVLWTHADHVALAGWVGAAWLVAIGRLLLGRAYRRVPQDKRDHGLWGRRFAWGSGINGVVWGAGALWLYPPDAIALQVLIMFVVGGMVAGAAASTSTYLPAFLAFTLPAVGGIAVRLVTNIDRVHGVMAVMLVLFAGAMAAIARRGGQMLATSERLRLVNDDLARKLVQARDELLAANESLEERVRERARQAEEAMAQLAQTNLLASIGQLASGIAHEINNPLSVIISNVDQLQDDIAPPAESDIGEMLDDARIGADRIKDIVADLRLLARARSREPTEVRTEQMLRSCANLLVHQLRQRATVEWALGDDVPPVRATEAAVAQVVLNLLIDAVQAIPVGKPNEHVVHIGTRLAADDAGAVTIEIRYDGAPDHEPHGLAVALCRNVLAENDGSLDLRSNDDGTTSAVVALRAATS